ncbi:MAG TPA: CBS domain-containing protein [Polyangiaceae bacterium]|nr:CBS domain-containing protein [Polyangiaceae bacterium]
MTDSATLVREVMTTDPAVISPDQTLERAWAMMTDEGYRHLPVVEGGQLVGVLTITDIGRLGATVPSLMARSVGEWMTKTPITVKPDEPIESAAAQMGIHKVNCLPVVAGGKLVGIVTTYDLLDALARQLGPRSLRSGQ